MFVGLLSDTHGVFSKEFADFLSPVDVIWHAGDWGGGLGFVQQIRDLGKPVVGVYGNCDGLDIREEFPEYQLFTEEGVRVLITHIGGSPGHYYPRAKELLRDTSMRLSDIAMEIGYNEPNYFSHVFRKTEGITPKEYRRLQGRQ